MTHEFTVTVAFDGDGPNPDALAAAIRAALIHASQRDLSGCAALDATLGFTVVPVGPFECCPTCGHSEGSYVPSGSADAYCLHCGEAWDSSDLDSDHVPCDECGRQGGTVGAHAYSCSLFPHRN